MTGRLSPRRDSFSRGAMVAATLTFLVLGVSLASLMSYYRASVLEPRLRDEAAAQAEILSRSQAGFLAEVLRNGEGEARRQAVESALEELLLLRDPKSAQAYFESVALEVDPDALGVPKGSLDLSKGNPASRSAFATTVALYDPRTFEVLGVARFGVSSRLFQELSAKVRDELLRITFAVLALLFVLWVSLMGVLFRLERQTGRRFAAERELSRQEKRYERLVNNLSQYFVYRKDASGRLVSVSDSVKRVLGFTPLEFASRHADSLRVPWPPPESGPSFEVELVDAGGQAHQIELSEIAVANEGGALMAFDGIARDATAERRFREELEHAKNEAEAANLAKSRFLANMSHEIRTPLNAILGMTGLALRTVREPRERDYLEKVRVSARLLVEIIEDILDLSRIEAGKLELANAPFALAEILDEISDVIGVKAGIRGLEVLFQPQGSLPPWLVGDAVRLKQVLLNLLNNAVKFTERGEIVARIEAVEVAGDRAVLKFSVSDTGIGIPEAHLETLFEPFTQVDTSNARRYGGMGLGLAISRRLVRLMGGEIEVASRMGQGSSFSFTAAFGVPAGFTEARRLPAEWAGVRALVVDDNESARLALSGMLEMLACRVDAAASGEEALEMLARERDRAPYRIALVDWKMPGLDGIETASRLRALASEAALGLILVTADDWEEASRRGEGVGISTVLHKPLSPSALHDALVRTLAPGDRLRAAPGPGPTVRFEPGQVVLLVEDQPINRELARELLTQAGLEVREAANGHEALEALESSRPDVVLMDVQMPDMDGLTAVERIRANPALVGLPVIAMTAHAMMGDRERFLAMGMSDYVAKPIEEAQLFRVLGRWLRSFAHARTDGASPLPAVASTPPSAVLDREAGLRRAGGNRALYEKLLHSFAAEAPKILDRMKAAAARGDAAIVRRDLHTLKGNAATVSAVEIAAAAQALEREPERATKDVGFEGLDVALARFAAEMPIVTGAAGPLAAAAPTEEPLSEEDRLQAVNLARLLGEQVDAGNLAARRTFAELKGLIGPVLPAFIASIEPLLDRLDFTSASREIAALEAALGERARS